MRGVRDKENDRLVRIQAGLNSRLQELKNAADERDKENDRLVRIQAGLNSRLQELRNAADEREKEIDRLAGIEVSLHSKVAELEALKEKFRDKEAVLADRVKELQDRALKPLDVAKLVVKVSTKALPAWLDLDLYVQDPEDKICYWKEPRILTDYAETSMLIPSEDLRGVGTSAEEIFYSVRLIPASPNPTYLVFVMLRENGRQQPPEPLSVLVEWNVEFAVVRSLRKLRTENSFCNSRGELRFRRVVFAMKD